MRDSTLNECISIVLLGVETHNSFDPELLKAGNHFFDCASSAAILIEFDRRRVGKCQEFIGDNPVHIAVFELVHALVLHQIEGVHAEPAETHSFLKSDQAVQNLI